MFNHEDLFDLYLSEMSNLLNFICINIQGSPSVINVFKDWQLN